MSIDFYSSYRAYKNYQSPTLAAKDIARFDAEVWNPATFSPTMSCLEIGSGEGAFLAYLAARGVENFHGIDHDPALVAVQPSEVAAHFECADVWQYLDSASRAERTFERVLLFDVLEHFSPEEGFRLLSALKGVLAEEGKIVLKVPNASSPWGINYQFGDLTHKTAYNGESLRQLATAGGYHVEALYDQRRGSSRRMITDAILHRFLSWALLTPPPLWGANLYCILSSQK
ncbi:MAG: class I SAM-dependent methyltransferase [Rhodospirillales bacterium]|nr:class I SAM-dependent methyltransferase [Rhodospirillales bacterium]